MVHHVAWDPRTAGANGSDNSFRMRKPRPLLDTAPNDHVPTPEL